jgi:ABC-type dipeptide/oligopeptide/nickel transport system permease subunit
MTTAVSEAEAASVEALGNKRSRIPGLAAMRATAGFQRGMLVFGLALVLVFVVLAVFASLIAPYGFDQTGKGAKTFPTQGAPSAQHWFGTTVDGYDVLTRVIFGAQTALLVIVLAVAFSIVVGVPLGLISGYFGGKLDRVMVLVADALFVFPTLLLAIVVVVSISSGGSGKWSGILATAIAITVVYVPQYFRVVRNATVAAREEPYVEAARAIGASSPAVMIRYIFGNVVQTVPVIATLNAGDAILTLAGLGFLGVGIEPTAAADWGHDLNTAVQNDVSNGFWWSGVYPGLAIALLVLGVTLVGESLNDVLNPLLRTAKISRVILPPPMSARAKSQKAQSATQERIEAGAGPSEASGPGANR